MAATPGRPIPRLPLVGVLAAIGITATMDAGGLSALSALPLFPLMGAFWYLERHSRPSVGFVWGRWNHYVLAALYPVLVLGALALISAAAGAVNLPETDWARSLLNIALVTVSTILVAIVTEEGFFRGWLWASLERAGETPARVLIWTSVAFSLWHLSAVVLETGFDLPARQIPVFMVNAGVIGAVWGMLRRISGSVIVAGLSHGVWNGGAYVLFGFGTKAGALGIRDTGIYGPEAGVLGLVLNALFAAALWRWCRVPASPTEAHRSLPSSGPAIR